MSQKSYLDPVDSGFSELDGSSLEAKTKYGTIPSKQGNDKLGQSKSEENVSQDMNDINCLSEKKYDRDVWSNKTEYLMCAVSNAVGLGNVWRFPYLVYANGGGSFLIAYFSSLFFIGFPMFYMEVVLGQFSGLGPERLFGTISPIFGGLGFAMICVSIFVVIYYNVVIGWSLYYIFRGFASTLPWSSCTNLSSYHCSDDLANQTGNDPFMVGPAEDFFLYQMLGMDKAVYSWDNYGYIQWKMVLCLLGAWTILCLCLIKGITSAGKVYC